MKQSCLTLVPALLLAAVTPHAVAAQERSPQPTRVPVAVQASASVKVLSAARMEWRASSKEEPMVTGGQGGSSRSEVTMTLQRETGRKEPATVHYVDFH